MRLANRPMYEIYMMGERTPGHANEHISSIRISRGGKRVTGVKVPIIAKNSIHAMTKVKIKMQKLPC